MQPYRGARSRKRQQILNGVLIVAILAALSWVIFLLVFGAKKDTPTPPAADGSSAPSSTAGSQAEPTAPVVNDRMILLSAEDLMQQGAAEQLVAAHVLGKIDRVAIILKTENGKLWYPSKIPEVQNTAITAENTDALASALAKLGNEKVQLPLSAVLYAQEDALYPSVNPQAAIYNATTNRVWRDGSKHEWLDASADAANSYLSAVAKEVASLGFDEIILRGIGYPTNGRVDRIRYPEDKGAAVSASVAKIKKAVPKLRISVCLDTPFTAEDEQNGQNVDGLYQAADAVYAAPAEQTEAGVTALLGGVRAFTKDTQKLHPIVSDQTLFQSYQETVLLENVPASALTE